MTITRQYHNNVSSLLTAMLVWNANTQLAASFTATSRSTITTARSISTKWTKNVAFLVTIKPKHSAALKMSDRSSKEEDDFYDGYDDFVNNLDFKDDGWDNSYNNQDSFNGYGNGGGRMQRGGRGGRGGRYSQRHDYQRAPDDDMSQPCDVPTIEALLSERLSCRKTGQFDRADDIRDELSNVHGVTVWDKEKVWTTNSDRRGGSNRHGANGRYGKRQSSSAPRRQSRQRGFGPTGHDYEQIGGPINESVCSLSTDEINGLLAERLQCKMSRNFNAADAIQDELRNEGVLVHDGFKEWRADGDDWAASDRRGDRNNSGGPRGIVKIKEYRRRGSGSLLTQEEVQYIVGQVAKRSDAKMNRDYDLADEIRDELSNKYDVTIDDKSSQWAVRSEEYLFNSSGSTSTPDMDIQVLVGKMLGERILAKQRRDFDTADSIRDELRETYSVSINDRQKEWTVEGEPEERSYVNYDNDGQSDNGMTTPEWTNTDSNHYSNDNAEVTAVVDDAILSKPSNDNVSLESLTVPQLKEKLRDAGLPVSGRKSELVERLSSAP